MKHQFLHQPLEPDEDPLEPDVDYPLKLIPEYF